MPIMILKVIKVVHNNDWDIMDIDNLYYVISGDDIFQL